MNKNNINAYCDICGKGYHVCNSCSEEKSFKPWRSVTDTIDHYKIYMAVHEFSVSGNKEESKRMLGNCNLSDMAEFRPEIQKVIKAIMAEPEKKRKVIKQAKPDKEVCSEDTSEENDNNE